jgi:hypothetical protein
MTSINRKCHGAFDTNVEYLVVAGGGSGGAYDGGQGGGGGAGGLLYGAQATVGNSCKYRG